MIQPLARERAIDEAFGGYFNELEPASAITLDADVPTLFPVLHEAFAGELTCREDFSHFGAWMERNETAALALIAALKNSGPIIEVAGAP